MKVFFFGKTWTKWPAGREWGRHRAPTYTYRTFAGEPPSNVGWAFTAEHGPLSVSAPRRWTCHRRAEPTVADECGGRREGGGPHHRLRRCRGGFRRAPVTWAADRQRAGSGCAAQRDDTWGTDRSAAKLYSLIQNLNVKKYSYICYEHEL